MVNNRIEIPFAKLSDGNFMRQIFNNTFQKTAITPETDNIFVTGAQGKSSKEVLDEYTQFSETFHNLKSDSPLAKTIQAKNKNSKNGIFQMPSFEQSGDFEACFGVDNKLFGTEKESDWKKDEKERFKKADGKTGNFAQGATADCWLLSRLAAKDDRIIKKEKDGSFTVTLNNPDKQEETHKIKVTKDDFSNISNRNLSSGDPDAKIVEIAVKKLFKSLKINNGSIDFNTPGRSFGILSKKGFDIIQSDPSKPEYEKEVGRKLDKICLTSKVITVSTTGHGNGASFTGNLSANTDKFEQGHTYTLVKNDPIHKSLTIKNPYDTSKELTISYAEFAENFNEIDYESEENK
ncbi:MAG: hypothetical protein WCG23_07695 [bacterium]